MNVNVWFGCSHERTSSHSMISYRYLLVSSNVLANVSVLGFGLVTPSEMSSFSTLTPSISEYRHTRMNTYTPSCKHNPFNLLSDPQFLNCAGEAFCGNSVPRYVHHLFWCN